MLARLRRALAGAWRAFYCGAIVVSVVAALEPDGRRAGAVLLGALFGGLYGLCVLGLTRLFGARTWGIALAGLLSGPLPAALVFGSQANVEDRGGIVVLGCLLGLLIGLLEWNRTSARSSPTEP